jgi:hypothetical protein
MAPKVFLSYRRGDSPHATGRLRDRLTMAFGEENVFFDVDSIPTGRDFREVIQTAIQAADTVVVIIGPGFDVDRLSDQGDYVCMELLEAFRQKKLIVPVLLDTTSMPTPPALPSSLRNLAYINASLIRQDPDFHRDAERLVAVIERDLAAAPGTATVPSAGAAKAAPASAAKPPPASAEIFRRTSAAVVPPRGATQAPPSSAATARPGGTAGSRGARPVTTPARASSPATADQFASVPQGRLLHTLTTQSRHHVSAVSFSPDGRMLATGSDGLGAAWLWDPATGRHLRTLEVDRSAFKVISFSPDGRTLATGGRDAAVRLWGPVMGRQLRQLDGHTHVIALAFSPDGRQLAVGDWEGPVRLWDLASGLSHGQFRPTAPGGKATAALKLVTGRKPFLTRMTFSPDCRLLATGYSDGNVLLSNPATGEHQGSLRHDVASKSYTGIDVIAFNPGGDLLATANRGDIRIWDLTTGLYQHAHGAPPGEAHPYKVQAAAFSRSGDLLATGGARGNVLLWDPATGNHLRTFQPGTGPAAALRANTDCVAFSPDGSLLAAGQHGDSSNTPTAWVQLWG